MKRRIGRNNPFYDIPRFAFAYEQLSDGAKLLDYGCFEASFGAKLLRHKQIEYFGVDKNSEAVQRANSDLRVTAIKDRLPFENDFFDVVSILEVLEHVHDQAGLLRELHRVLKPGGMLIVSVPRKHVFSFLDSGNFKFAFPRLHEAYYTLKHSKAAYSSRYLNNPDGLIGDIEKAKSWHQHFRESEFTNLIEGNGFSIIELDGSGFLNGLYDFISLVMPPLRPLFSQRLRNWDSYTFGQVGLYCAAVKR